MKHIFISGTGTDVGKTFVSALLAASNPEYRYWKPVQTGGPDIDANAVRGSVERISGAACFSFEEALSPDQAAEAEGRAGPSIRELLTILRGRDEALLIEGAGGLMVPLNEANETWLDFLQEGRLPVVLVAQSGLGTLNHTLLSIEALQSRAIPILAVILNGPPHPKNLQSLRRMKADIDFYALPQDPDPEQRAAFSSDLWSRLQRATEAAPDEWLDYDRKYVWHPYTQHKTAPYPIPVVRGQGIYLESAEGERLIDASASWWTCSIGHGRPEIGEAIRRQQASLDHCGFGNATHEVGSRLANRLVAACEGDLQRVFYSDNGSCAVEVALKIAAQSWLNRGVRGRSKFLYFQGAYHGDTFGAMAVGESGGFHKEFTAFRIPGVESRVVTSHRSRLCPEGPMALDQGLADLSLCFEKHAHELAGVIIEPLIQGASGMNMQEVRWLQQLSRLCREWKVPLILDEVFTGMGRAGAPFAYQRAGIEPDILCLAKGLTGGNLPLAATLVREDLFAAFLDDDRSKALLHGHTFTGNPIACAAALATLDIYDRENLWNRGRVIEDAFRSWIEAVGGELGLHAPRALGGVLAFELGTGDYFDPLAYAAPAAARRNGLLLRTLGATLYFIPTLTIEKAELDTALRALHRTVRDLRNEERDG